MIVVPIAASGRMTEAEYARAREALAPTKREAGVRWEQELARLFVKSGWTQEELAKREGKPRRYIGRLIIFGKFLSFGPAGPSAESVAIGLTERRFREWWDRTDKCGGNERQRFAEVSKLMQSAGTPMAPRRPKIGPAIKEQFADGKWHRLETIAAAIEEPSDYVLSTLRTMHTLRTYGCKAEWRKHGTSTEWRIFPEEKTVSSTELAEKLAPIIKELLIQGKCNMATMSPAQVAVLANRLQKQLDEWTE